MGSGRSKKNRRLLNDRLGSYGGGNPGDQALYNSAAGTVHHQSHNGPSPHSYNERPDIYHHGSAGVLPRIHNAGSTEPSEYFANGAGSVTNPNESISTVPPQGAANYHHRHGHHASNSQLKSDETIHNQMNARFEQSKGAMSPSPDLRVHQPPMYSNNKRSGNNIYHSNKKSTASRIDHMSGQTAEASFIDAPPIPYQKRYMADVRNQSASTHLMPSASKE